ncbi:N-acetylmuramoyl-L-alanine amidase [Wenjunlia vitaminophila]|uniref:N-acetylmuramoyl-L-alanine amidase n=1 Tax=Wenjunlia vitaminophila TaxID=76728 RepID=A0A0T6LXD8_WENVI|nr:peptidoglycan recognition protein [Wenjunlia vitaminophila]KRV50680.1 N-acetylmuramoyl-L-alanine amidase [Wenjunlia vitaminophila]KRV50770.1 N-acetylmuramoyl-L-alanine amidase [Wenjunlia vitaminophila]
MRSRRVWGTSAAVAAGVSGVLVLQGVTGAASGNAQESREPQGPVRAQVREAALRVAEDGRSATLRQLDTARFSMLGVSWADPSARAAGTVEVRTRDAESGQWSDWLRLDDDGGRNDDGVRGGTEPAWVGPSDGVEVRMSTSARSSAALPKGLRLHMIDPSSAAADDGSSLAVQPAAAIAEVGADASVEEVPTAPESTAPRPPITDRAGWGADESISPEAPEYLPGGVVKAVVVHHTAESNSYTCAEAPAVIRGIYTYHVKTLGWKDIGYNFLVDKCGTVYEGRKGGVDRPVLGAHAYGFNTETTGISVLGTYTDIAASKSALTAVARVAAWKLGQYGGNPAGTTTLTAGDSGTNYFGKSWAKGAQLTFPQIHGHRDGYNTQCPGDQLYGQLATIRSYAAGPVTGLAVTSITGAGKAGSTYYTKAQITVNWTASTPAALISRYELLVDGKVVATTAGSATSARATLALGSHAVQVRAVHQSGKTTTTSAATVVAETTPPTFTTKPYTTLRLGTVNVSAVPITLRWKATDNAALKSVKLTKPTTSTYGPTTTASARTIPLSTTATTFAMTAQDQAGNTASASHSSTALIRHESVATRYGAWTTRSSSSYLGGKSYSSGSRGASLTWTFTGRAVAWVVSRASTSGQAYVYVDGTRVATVDLRSSTTMYRNAIWAKAWTTSATHTVKIVVVGTSGRPTVTTDGIVYLK